MASQSIGYRSKSRLVADELRRLIDDGEVEPGEVLRQRDVAERFGISPTPVREALRQLEAEGLILTEAHRGATVVRSQDSRLEENRRIRATLEGLGGRLAAEKRSPADIAAIGDLHEQLTKVDPDNTERILGLNQEFHFRIYEAAASPVMVAQIKLLWGMMDFSHRVDRSHAESVAQHAAILEAIVGGDGESADARIREHILQARYHESFS